MLLQILGSFAEFERELLRERVRAGLANARRKGKQLGKPRIEIDLGKARDLRAEGHSCQAIAAKLGVSVGTIHGALTNEALSDHFGQSAEGCNPAPRQSQGNEATINDHGQNCGGSWYTIRRKTFSDISRFIASPGLFRSKHLS
jgi:hypothetical protein